jgi:hypothetical protein
MVMLLQDNDPHHLHPDPNYIYYFVISAVILVAVVLVVGWNLMSFLDSRYERRKKSREKDAETDSADEKRRTK